MRRRSGRSVVLKGALVAIGITASTVGAITAVTAAAGWIVTGVSSTRSKLQLAMPAGPALRALADRDDMPTGSIHRVASAAPTDYRNFVPHLKFDTGLPVVVNSTTVEKTSSPRVQQASLEDVAIPASLQDRFADLAPPPLQPAVAAVLAVPPPRRAREREEPVPLPQARPKLAYARPDFDDTPVTPAPAPSATDMHTAVYDITAHTVYLPSGRKLEAHSGLGESMDDPSSMRRRMRGVTPPNVYNLTLREAMFHGVQAIRLNPVDEDKMFGRDGILAHTYMLGPNGQSNGCVSFRDYSEFLAAFRRGEVDRMVVVERNGNIRAAELHGRPVEKYAFIDSPSVATRSERRRAEAYAPRPDTETGRADVW